MVWSKLECQNQLFQGTVKGENILEGSQDLIPSPSVKIQIMSYKGKKIAGCCQQAFETRKFADINQQCFTLLTQVNFPAENLNFHWCQFLTFFTTC